MRCSRAALLALALTAAGCASQDIPQAYRGRMFSRTGLFALYIGGNGFTGPVLGPGTYYTGGYNELRMVQCSMVTEREPLTALTKDGVQFGLDVYVRFSANCEDESVKKILDRVIPDAEGSISANALYQIFIRPTLGAVVREVVSPYRANDINDKREAVLSSIRQRFMEQMKQTEKDMLTVFDVTLSNLDFPDAMDAANVERAVQAVLRDKAVAERERVEAEIETAKLREKLAQQEAENIAIRVLRVGEALKKYPEYLQFDLQSRMPEIYRQAGANGNLIVAAPNPVVAGPQPRASSPPADIDPRTGHYPSAEHPNPLTGHDSRPPAKEP
jgi:regulator of protease activity HflC (stomatin/prohibitin superfamily)